MVNLEQLKLMKHMLGLNYKKKPYRNYGFFYSEQDDFEDLVNKQLATKRVVNEEGHVFYHLTKSGAELVYGKPMSQKFYDSL